MKIYGSNQPNLNPYNNQQYKHVKHTKKLNNRDQLEISNVAKQLQKGEQLHSKRDSYIEEIKNSIRSGEYKIEYEKTARKLIDFWSKRG